MDNFTLETKRATYEASHSDDVWLVKWTMSEKIWGEVYIRNATETYVCQWIFAFDKALGNYA